MSDISSSTSTSISNGSPQQVPVVKKSSNTIVIMLLIILVLFLCCICSVVTIFLSTGLLGGFMKYSSTVSDQEPYVLEDDYEDDQTDLYDDFDEDSQQEEWVVDEFSLDIPLTESKLAFTLELPNFARKSVESEYFNTYANAPYFSLTIFTLPEAYSNSLSDIEYLFYHDLFGDVYRVHVDDSGTYYYSSDVIETGDCNSMGDIIPAPCGAEILVDWQNDIFFMATCQATSDEGLYYCDEIIKSISTSIEY